MPGPNFRPTPPLSGITQLGVGVIGYGWIGRAHSVALARLREASWPPTVLPRLVAICGRHEQRLQEAAQRFGYEGYYTDWRDLLADERVQVVINGAQAYMHPEPTIAALRAGKHVLCEKPLAPGLDEARQMLEAARTAAGLSMTGFNYRFVPALRLARDLVQSGALGPINLFRGHYFNEFRRDPNLPAFGTAPEVRGRGALNDIGSHLIDMARFVVGEIETVSGKVLTHLTPRPSPTRTGSMEEVPQEDSFHFVAEFANGTTGVMEGAAIATGRKNQFTIEVNGVRGSVRFNLERLNELEVYLQDEANPQTMGFRDVLVTEGNHPYMKYWWMKGHIIGWEATLLHEIHHFLTCIHEGRAVGPEGANLEDGFAAARVAEAVRQSSREGRRVDVKTLG
ncbi:MAG: Gfo/Idh/MocA family protein [Chloroflexota bacterium]